MKIIATKNVNGAWYWRIVGGNGEISTISRTVGQMEGELKQIANRNKTIDDKKIT